VPSGPLGTSGPTDRFARPGITLTLMFGQMRWNWQAERTEGREGIVAERLPHDELLALLSEHGRLAGRPA
jgi:hypothetical protein